ncbi:MAG: cation:proton antiporter [bacterium]|nr:cation:proton antiporter [bacterium]
MPLFVELSIVVGIAAAMALVMRFLRQPLIIGHILTGLIVGPFVLGLMHSAETFTLFSEIGIAILLFTVGLNLNPHIIREFGRVSVIAGVGQVVATALIGYTICLALGFPPLASFYISAALAFSSTVIILKLLADKGDMERLYAKIAVGFLLVQDFIAIILLFAMPMLSSGGSVLATIAMVSTGIALISIVFLVAHYCMPRFSYHVSHSHEMLFLFAIAWGMGVAAIFKGFGFSLESGALIAGVALASLPSRHEINARLTPLRDFFIIIFFVLLGSQMKLESLVPILPIALVLSALVLIGKPLIVMAIMGWLGYRKKTSLQMGCAVAQISEFSLILVAMGVTYRHFDDTILSLVTLVGLVTIFGSSYLMVYTDALYSKLEPYLGVFERKDAHEKRIQRQSFEIVLFGCNRIGYDFLQELSKLGKKFLVVDHDPEVVKQLEAQNIATEYGDAGTIDFLESLDFSRTKLVISTIPETETNQLLNKVVRECNPKTIVIVAAHRIQDAFSHYDNGADYVIMPHFLGGKHAAELIIKLKNDPRKYKSLKKEHIEHLQLRIAVGHEHPVEHARVR